MLTRLYISNVVLIDKLELDLSKGLSVITGETGAGKSILLDALDLALGGKADVGLIRAGTDTATVIAEFDDLMLKRVISSDGKSKCYVNDEPVALKTLKEQGDQLVEIHGQFATHGLLDEKTHIHLLDEFGGYDTESIKSTFKELHDAEKELKEFKLMVEKSAAEREFLEHSVGELEKLKPQVGEEETLAETRQNMMNMERNASVLKEAAATIDENNLAEKCFAAAHILERTKSYQPQIDKLYDIGSVLQEISAQIAPADFDTNVLESAEERLFALRAAARKHRISVDELPAYLAKAQADLNKIENSDDELKKLESDVSLKKSNYEKLAVKLSSERKLATEKLCAAIKSELPDLKLGNADFTVEISETGQPTENGSDAVRFMIKTNPGSPFAPLDKIASGGELARFMLAMRVVLMNGNKTLIFDEIDTGISGATAAAVGARLGRLASNQQIITITHSAQVAGFGDEHFLISKETNGQTTTANMVKISGDARIHEIARIISGEKITTDALETAKVLLNHI